MSSGFEETFARIVDRKMAPPIMRWMMGQETFTARDYRLAFNLSPDAGNATMKSYIDKGLVEIVHQGSPGNTKDYNIYKWVGKI